MIRILPLLMLLSIVLSIVLPVHGIAEELPKDIMNSLEALEQTPLPGENDGEGLPVDAAPPSDIIGKTILRIEAVDPPAGFDPVQDGNIPLGIPLSAAVVRRATSRLWETGFYSDVKVWAAAVGSNGVELFIEVTPMLRVKSLEVSGNRVLDDEDVARAIDYTADRTIRAEPEVLRQLKGMLLQAYSEKGYLETQAALRIETTATPGAVVLVIRIEEGRPERFEKILFTGLPEDLDGQYLLRSTKLEEGMPRNRREVEDNLHRIETFLFNYGYLDAQLAPIVEQRLGRYSVRLTIPIRAGIKTEIEILNNRSLRKADLQSQLFTDGIFRTSASSLATGLTRLQRYGRQRGFFHFQADVQRICHTGQGKGTVTPADHPCKPGTVQQKLQFNIFEGPEVEVVTVGFNGNHYLSDEDLEEEIFAFMKERIEIRDPFQPFSTPSLDDVGVSNKSGDEREGHRGLMVPRGNKSRTYVPELYADAMTHLREIYQEQGFLSAQVTDRCSLPKKEALPYKGQSFSPFIIHRDEEEDEDKNEAPVPCIFINPDRDQLLVHVAVAEGPQTQLAQITFEGHRVFPAATLREVSTLSVKDPFNEYQLGESERAVEAFYKEAGYMFVDVQWSRTFSKDMKQAEILFTVKEGPQVRVGRIRIEGAGGTSEKLIRERLTIAHGTVITPSKLEQSQQRLMELGIFDSGLVQMVSPETPASVKNVVVQLREGDFQYMELRGGMASIEGLRGGFEYGYRNIAGWAINARFRARANYRLFFPGADNSEVIHQFEEQFMGLNLLDRIEHHVMFSLTQNHFPGTYGFLGWGLDGTRERLNEPAFGATRNTAFFRLNTAHSLGTRFTRALLLETRTGIEDTDLQVWAAAEDSYSVGNPTHQQFLRRMPDGTTVFWVTGLRVGLDFRDHPLNPTRGFRISLGGDYVTNIADFNNVYEWTNTGLEPGEEVPSSITQDDLNSFIDNDQVEVIERKSNLIRANASIAGYIPFSDNGTTLALSLSGGYIFHLEDGSQTWADRYFYAGGVSTLRGFPEESLIAEDVYQEYVDRKKEPLGSPQSNAETEALLKSPGGEVMFIARAEFRYPFTRGFFGAVFGEAGNVRRRQNKVNLYDLNPFRLHLRPVAGGGIRYLTALGLFSLDVGINLNRRSHEAALSPFLSIGSAF